MIALLQIGQYLSKLCVDYVGLLFWPTLYTHKDLHGNEIWAMRGDPVVYRLEIIY